MIGSLSADQMCSGTDHVSIVKSSAQQNTEIQKSELIILKQPIT